MSINSWIRSQSTRQLGPAATTSPNHACANKRAALKRFKVTYSTMQLEHLEERAYLTAVALLAADEPFWAADVQTKLESTGLFTSVTPIDVRSLTPTLAELSAYDGVLVWNNYPFADPTTLGDNLADYVDAGHGVVVATFANTNFAPLVGRWSSGGYDVIAPSVYEGFNQLTLGDVAQPGHPIMNGVTNFDGGLASWHSLGGLTVGSSLIASWSDGSPLVAEKSNLNIGLNFFPPSSDSYSEGWVSSTDGALLLGNALNYVTGFSARAITPAGGEVVFNQPTDFVIDLSADYDPTSVDVSDLTVNGITPTSVDQTDANTLTFYYAVSPVTSQGLQTMHMAAGSVTALDSGELVRELNATFRYDGLLMQVTSTNPANTSVVLLPFTTLDLNFSEAYAFSSAQASDFSVNQGGVSGVSQVDADTLRLTLSGVVAEGTLTVNMAAGAVTDVYGNPGAAFSGSYTLDFGIAPFPTPLRAVAPAGSLIYDGSQVGFIDPAGDSDSFSILVDPGQKITVTVDPAGSLRPIVELYRVGDNGNALIGSATAGSAGLEAVLQTVAGHGQIGVMGPGPKTYLIVVSGAGGTTGAYKVRMILNAAVENEQHDGAANNTRATAQNLEPSFLTFNASVSSSQGAAYPGRGAVLGTLEAATLTVLDSDDFESEGLGGQWVTYSSQPEGRVQVTDVAGSAGGSFAVLMDRNPSGTNNLNEAIWTVDLTGQTAVVLQFAHNDFNDEEDGLPLDFVGHANGDGVAISDDGVNWRRILDATNTSFAWKDVSIDLAAEAAAAGMTLGAGFQIKFQQYDNFPFDIDGRAYDQIVVGVPVQAQDFHSFTLRAGESVTLALKGGGNLELQNAAGTTLATAGSGATNVNAVISDFIAPKAGTYYARISSASFTASDHVLVVTRNAGFDTEDNNTIATAQSLLSTQVAGKQWQLGSIQSGGGGLYATSGFGAELIKIDPETGSSTFVGPFGTSETYSTAFTPDGTFWTIMFSFSPDLAQLATVDLETGALTPVGSPNWTGGAVLAMDADAGGNLYAGGFDDGNLYSVDKVTGQMTAIGFMGAFATVDFSFDNDGTLWAVDVDSNLWTIDTVTGAATYHASISGVNGGAYGLMVDPTDNTFYVSTYTDFSAFYRLDPDTGIATLVGDMGTFYALGGDFAPVIHDKDYYRITADELKRLEISTLTPAGKDGEFVNNLDPMIRIYNSSGVLVASDDNSDPDGRNANVSYKVPKGAGGTYYIEVLSSTATAEPTKGEYILTVNGNTDDLEVMRTTVAIGAKIVSPFLTPAVVNPASLGMLAKVETISSMDGYQAPVGQRMSMNYLASLDATLGLLPLGLSDDSAADLWLETEDTDVDDLLSALNPGSRVRLLDEFFAELQDIGT